MLTKVALNCSKFSELLPRAARSRNNTNMFTTILLWLFTRVWATIPVITLPGLLHGRASTGMQRKNVCTTLCLHLQALSTCKVSDSRDFELYWFIPFQTTHFWWQQQRTQTASDKINKKQRNGLYVLQNNDTSKMYRQAFCNFFKATKTEVLPRQGARLIKLHVQ